MKYMDWAAMGAASSAYAEASRARSENQDLWHQNQRLSNQLGRLQAELGQYQDDIAQRKSIEEYQAWIEEFVYQFTKAVTEISSGLKDPITDFSVIASFLDIINTNSLDTSNIRGLENKSTFDQTFSKAQNLFNELEKTPEVQNHLRQIEEARLEKEHKQEQLKREQIESERLESEISKQKVDIAAKKRAQVGKIVVALVVVILTLLLVFNYMDNQRSTNRDIDNQKTTDGDADTEYKTGDMYYDGEGAAQNYREALKWYRKAAEKGHVEAQHDIGYMYYHGHDGVQQDYSESLKWFQKAAAQGNVDAQFMVNKVEAELSASSNKSKESSTYSAPEIANSEKLKVSYSTVAVFIESGTGEIRPRRIGINCESGGFFSAPKGFYYKTVLQRGTNRIPLPDFIAKDGLRFNPITHVVVNIWVFDGEEDFSVHREYR